MVIDIGAPGSYRLSADDVMPLLEPATTDEASPKPVAIPEPLPLLMVTIGVALYRVRLPHMAPRENGVTSS